jgi:hypothetical protein
MMNNKLTVDQIVFLVDQTSKLHLMMKSNGEAESNDEGAHKAAS